VDGSGFSSFTSFPVICYATGSNFFLRTNLQAPSDDLAPVLRGGPSVQKLSLVE